MRASIKIRYLAVAVLLCSFSAYAEDAKVIGPQSVIEQYDAPVVESKTGQVLIDFPSMISAPGENDGVEVIGSLTALILDFVAGDQVNVKISDSDADSKQFVSFAGHTKAKKDGAALHNKLREALVDYRDLPLTIGDLRFIQQDIADVYRELGYPLMSVVVPPQEVVNATLLVQINEFSLASYQVTYSDKQGGYSAESKHWSKSERLERYFQSIVDEPILSQKSLDKQLEKVNRNPFRSARVVFEPGEDIGQSKAIVQIDEKRLWNLQAGYNNHATKQSGTHRASVGGSFGNLPLADHQISWNAVIGPEFDEFQNYSLIYKRWGHMLTANANYSDTASSSIPGIESASTTLQMSLNYDVELMSGQSYEWKGSIKTSIKRFERASLFGGATVGGAEFDAVQLGLSSTLNLREANASNQFTFTLTRSFEGIFGNNELADFRQFHNSVKGEPDYTFFGFNYARVQQLSILGEEWNGWSTETQSSVQIAFDELAGSDNFALGGANILRAYQSSEIAGDKGWYVSQMLHGPAIPLDKLAGFSGVVKQVVVSGFVETGEARFENGGDNQIWDFGLRARTSFAKNVGCDASLAIAGDNGSRTGKNDTRFFLSCNWSY